MLIVLKSQWAVTTRGKSGGKDILKAGSWLFSECDVGPSPGASGQDLHKLEERFPRGQPWRSAPRQPSFLPTRSALGATLCWVGDRRREAAWDKVPKDSLDPGR